MAYKRGGRTDLPPYIGYSTDNLPGYALTGAKAIEVDTARQYIFNGSGWSIYPKKFYLDTRTTVSITTSSCTFSGGTIIKYGELLREYIFTNGGSTGTMTFKITDANSVVVFQSSATTDTATARRVLPTTEQVILDGTYTVTEVYSATPGTSGTNYFTLGFERIGVN